MAPFQGRVRKVMQEVSGTGQVSAGVVRAMTELVEVFVEDLVGEALKTAAVELDVATLKHTIERHKRFDFLRSVEVDAEAAASFNRATAKRRKIQQEEGSHEAEDTVGESAKFDIGRFELLVQNPSREEEKPSSPEEYD